MKDSRSPIPASLGGSSPKVTPPARPGLRFLELPDDFPLLHGGAFERPRLAFEDTGGDGPVVVALGGISATSHVTATAEDPRPGWWQPLIGPKHAVDTDRFRVVSYDYVGGNGASSSPVDPAGPRPTPITTEDQARALVALLDELDVDRLHAFVGASYGGMVGLALAALSPERLEHLVVISAAHRTHPLATGWRSVQRRILRLAIEQDVVAEGVALARSLAMTTYRSAEELLERFSGLPERTELGFRFPVEDYLEARGEDFSGRFDPLAFLRLSESIDLHRAEPESITARTTLVAVRSDQLVPLTLMHQLNDLLSGPSEIFELESIYGHDAFLKEYEFLTRTLKPILEDREAGS